MEGTEVPEPGRPSQSRATLSDVARLAGVSLKTASRAIAGEANVRPATREKVIEAARQLRFRPNRLARALASGAVSQTIGFVVGDLANPFYGQVASGVEEAASANGLDIVLAATDDDPEREDAVVRAMIERRVQALLLVTAGDDNRYLDTERRLGTPIVFVDRPPVGIDADQVLIDNKRGACLATDHLMVHGHRRIGVIGDAASLYTAQERLDGFLASMSPIATPMSPKLIRTDAHSVAAAGTAAKDLLALVDPPTAILALNNRISVGVIGALLERPREQWPAFVGFDDFELAAELGITVIAHDPPEMGRRAADLAMRRLDEPSDCATIEMIAARLVPRGSGEVLAT